MEMGVWTRNTGVFKSPRQEALHFILIVYISINESWIETVVQVEVMHYTVRSTNEDSRQ